MTTTLNTHDLIQNYSLLDCIISAQTLPQKYQPLEGSHPRTPSKASKQSNKSKYSNKNKLMKSTLYEVFKREKAGKVSTVVEERNMQINLLEQSLQIQHKNSIQLKINMQKQFQQCSGVCSRLLEELDKVY